MVRKNGPQAKFFRSALVQPIQGETRVRSIRPHRLRARQVKPDHPGFEPKQQRKGPSPAQMRRKVSESGVVRLCRARTRVNFRDKPVQGAGEERGWRLAERVGTLKALRGAPPEGLGVLQGGHDRPKGWRAIDLLLPEFPICLSIGFPIATVIAAAIGGP